MNEFTFQWPNALLLLLGIPLIVALLNRARSMRIKLIQELGGDIHSHRSLRDALRIVATVLIVLAFARPGHSPQAESTAKTGRDIIFVLDVSRSMLATDIAPSRLEIAKQAIRDALQTFSSQRVGLVIYAGSASILCPLTYDYEFVRFMLDQAHPRSVDFGGTTLQSAIEKVVDQILMPDRAGLQDLIVLTDGGDHGSQIPQIIELLEEHEADCLVVGLGNPILGVPIPILDEAGNPAMLEENGRVVYTRLEDESLSLFASNTDRADYVAVGTRPFSLGQIYADYALNRPFTTNIQETGTVVYQEAASWFIVPAIALLMLAECWGARGLQLGSATVIALTFLSPKNTYAADENFEQAFDLAAELLSNNQYAEAEDAFQALYQNADQRAANPRHLAAIQINRGLALLKIAESFTEEAPEAALERVESAQIAFLSAKRYDPESQRAGKRVQASSEWIEHLTAEIQKQAEREALIDQEIEAIVERLNLLLDKQIEIHEVTQWIDVDRRLQSKTTASTPINISQDASITSLQNAQMQGDLALETEGILVAMKAIDEKLAIPAASGLPEVDTLFKEPIEILSQVIITQEHAEELLRSSSSWPAARTSQETAIRLIREILEILLSDSQSASNENENLEKYDEEYNFEDFEEYNESVSSSQMSEGDFASDAGMQALPTPNYSAEDILSEEQGNLQFRQQKRARTNSEKVKKDY